MEESAATEGFALEPAPPAFTIQPIAGFWRRLAAFVVDVLILAVAGQVVGWLFSSFWFGLGPYGRIVGQSAALIYFGLMDSGLCGGQTLGKRLFRVAVRDADGHSISVKRSALRTLVWLVPVTLNGWAVPILSTPAVSAAASVVLFGIGGAVLVTMVFNQRSRQGLHDMLAGTYVLRVNRPPVAELPHAAKLQWFLSGAMIILMLLLAGTSLVIASHAGGSYGAVADLQKTLQQDGRYFSVSIAERTYYGSNRAASRVLMIQVWHKGAATAAEQTAIIDDLARAALEVEGVEQYDLVRVDVVSQWDLGFATGHVGAGEGETVGEWKRQLGSD